MDHEPGTIIVIVENSLEDDKKTKLVFPWKSVIQTPKKGLLA